MSEYNVKTINSYHDVENHSYEKMLSEFHFGVMPATKFSVIHWGKYSLLISPNSE